MYPSLNPESSDPRPVCNIVTPIGMLGYGFDGQEMNDTLSALTTNSSIPTALILDSGSTDGGPKKLAMGEMTCPSSSYKRDLGRLLEGVTRYNVPLLIGSAGGAGINTHVEELTKMIDDLSKENLSVVQIFSQIDKNLVTDRFTTGNITSCGSAVPTLQQIDIDESTVIVAQMGPEPFIRAMKQHPDFNVIIGGRAYDPAPYVAFATTCLQKLDPLYSKQSIDRISRVQGGIMHMGKIMECGGLCATPKSAGAVATVYEDGSFDVRPTLPTSRCTPLSVASHTLYEKTRPDILSGPGGWLDVGESTYVSKPDNITVHVEGSSFHYSVDNGKAYQVKLEAARNKGFRSMYLGCHRDPILIAQIDEQMRLIKDYVRSNNDSLVDGTWDLDWHVYGRENSKVSGEIFIVGESRAETQELARSIASLARIATIHGPYPGQKATSGNFAFGIGATTEVSLGPCSEFCVYHLMDLQPGEEMSLFPAKLVSIQNKENSEAQTKSLANGALRANETPKSHKSDIFRAANTSNLNLKEARTLCDAASVLRSKNAGPYEITFDIMFDRQEAYEVVKSSRFLTQDLIAKLYGLRQEEVVWCGFFDPAMAFKATIPRKRRGMAASSGGYLEDDVHGAQMYVPLMKLELPESVQQRLRAL